MILPSALVASLLFVIEASAQTTSMGSTGGTGTTTTAPTTTTTGTGTGMGATTSTGTGGTGRASTTSQAISTSFSGALGFSGGAGTTGGTGTLGTGRTGGATGFSVPSSSNPFGPTMKNPLSYGVYQIGTGSSTTPTTAKTSFGQPLYPPTTGGNTGTSGGFGNTGGVGGGVGGGNLGAGGTGSSTATPTSFTTYGTPRAPVYVTALDESIPLVQHSAPALEKKLETMLGRSTTLKTVKGLDLSVAEGTVTLRGEVSSERERKKVEGMVRLTPGVREVNNELSIRGE